MPVDTSFYKAPEPYNPLEAAGKAVGIGNALQQNRLMQAQTRQANIGVDASQLELANKRFQNINSLLAPLAAKDNVSQKEIRDLMVDGIAQGLFTPQQMAVELQNLPKGDDGKANADYLRGKVLQIQDAKTKLDAIYGTPQMINQGGQVTPMAISPVTGMRQIGAPVPIGLSPQMVDVGNKLVPVSGMPPVLEKGLSPESATSPVNAFDPASGQPMAMTREQFIQRATGSAPTNRLTGESEPINPNERVMPNPIGVPTAPALGAEAAANVMGQQSAQQAISLQQAADSVPQRKALLGQMEVALQDFKSGVGSDTFKTAISGLNTALPKEWNVRAERVGSQEEFNKLAEQYLQSQFQSLGGTGTDSKLESALRSSPNSTLSDMGNKKIISLLKGNEDAIAVKNQVWQDLMASGESAKNYGKFTADFNKNYDPRVFQSQYMEAKDRSAMINGMSDNEKAKFRKAYNKAVDAGWIPDPRGQ